MKTKLNILSQFGIASVVAGSLCLAAAASGQTESKKKSDADASAQVATTTDASAKSSLGEKDKKFVKKAARGGMMEVDMGKMAEEQAKNDDVKAFGKRMVNDHSKAGEELKAIAEKKGVKMPGKKGEHKWTSDKDYMDMMVKDHEKDLAEFQAEAKEGSDSDLKEFAEKGVKMIQEHLELAKETQGKLK